MNEIPEVLKERIILDTIILKKNKNWNNIHQEIILLNKKPIKSVIMIKKKLYRYNLRYYKVNKNLIELPKLNNTENFYSFGYISRITDNSIEWNKLPWLQNINVYDLKFS